MKKALKITGIILLVLVIAIIAAPFIFKGQLEDLLKKNINKNLNATVQWEELDLTLFSSFPDAALQIKNFTVINKAPFEGDTLASGSLLQLDMGVRQLFKITESIKVDAIRLDDALINIKIDSLGNANYDIAIKDETPTGNDKETSGDFQLDLQHYELNNSRVNYLDDSTQTFLRITEVNHKGDGDFSATLSTLDTETEALVSFDMAGINYLKNNKMKLTAAIEMDLEKQRYTFKENQGKVNQLPLVFSGWVQINEDNNEMDLSFETPESDFKNFLAVMPEVYAKNLDGVTTTGDFRVNGKIKGIVDEETIPNLDIAIKSDSASFKYPDLPKTVRNITIDAQILNETGNVDDTYLRLGNVTFTIDEDTFAARGRIDRLTTNPLIDLALQGRLDLANLEKAYPLELEQDLNGMLNVDMTTRFDMESVEKERYQNIQSAGTASVRDFRYESPELPNALLISETDIKFNPGTINLQKMEAKTGQTDMAVIGTIENLIPFLLSDQVLKGRFNLKSNQVNMADFSVVQTETPTEGKETQNKSAAGTPGETAIKIPSFLDVILDFTAGKVIYDNITLSNVKGSMAIFEETATLSNVRADIFKGNIGLNGNVSTKAQTPSFAMDVNLNSVDIGQSFEGLDLLKNLAPIAKALEGALSTDLSLRGNLSEDLTPILSSLAGSALAELLTAKVKPEQMVLLNTLDSKLDFINLQNINLNNLKTQLTFNDGRVDVKPFSFNVKGIEVGVKGSHSLQNEMNYTLDLNLPARYLGDKIGGTLAQLGNVNLEEYNVVLPVGVSGNFSNPQVSLNMQQAVTSLTQQIVATQKEKLQQQGTEKIKDALGGILGGTKKDTTAGKPADTLKTKLKTEQVVKDVLGGLLGKKKKPADSTKTGN